jgi:hypothetical protein
MSAAEGGVTRVRPRAAVLRTVIGVWALGAGLGALAGWVWALTAPRVVLEYFTSGPVPEGYQEEGYVSSDGIAALLMIGIGALLAAVLISLRPRAPLQVLGVGVVGALLAALPMWGIVTAVHAAEVAAFPTGLADGALVDAPRDVRMTAVYLLGAIAVALIATVQAAVLWAIPRRTATPA